MRASVLLATALFAAVHAAPVAEPVKIVTDVVDVYTTVYVNGAAPTPSAQAQAKAAQKAAAPVAAAVANPVKANAASATSAVAAVKVQAAANVDSLPNAPSSGYVNAYNGNTYARRVVDHHNAHRANHSAGAMTWDGNLAAYAYEIANSCVYAHDRTVGSKDYGQNILAGAVPDDITGAITESFYNGEYNAYANLHGFGAAKRSDFDTTFEQYGHFSQLVWKDTNKVGCATVNCSGRGKGPKGLANVGEGVSPYFTVCNYLPAGNWPDNFDTQVGKPLGWPTISRSYRF